MSNFLFEDIHHIIFVQFRMFRQEGFYPVCMFFQSFVGTDVFLLDDIICQILKLCFQSCRQDCQTHNFDQTDVFFFDVMFLCMRMIYAKRILICRQVVSQSQIQFKHIADFSCDRCDRVMWLSICLSKDVCIGVGIASPCTKYMVSQIDQTFLVFAANTQYGQRPFYDAGFHILVSRDLNVFLDRCFCHCKLVIAALIVVMA